ncbi:MAG: 2,3-bisphosphoglycerate-independent phosphoglycerate mutase [Patescibacteria group bacterium]|nr:2,3-bisphosphoglycerate-independent phosphoglycerate mutase [Patescibacteria group bacterium]
MQKTKHPLALIILDGFGTKKDQLGNAIALARKPNFDFFCQYFPKTTLAHSGLAVGLPSGIVGNSEVGHKSIGCGRVTVQTMFAIQKSMFYGQFFDNPALKKSIEHARANNSKLHIIGLLSDGGGHSHIDHLFGIFRLLIANNFKENVYLHFFSDGRDVPPKSFSEYFHLVKETLTDSGIHAKIASVGGRYWGMDRAENWDRIEKSYNTMVGISENKLEENKVLDYFQKSYEKNITDEFIEPATIVDESGKPVGPVQDNDAVIFFNFRPDRMRQILRCFFDEDFPYFERKKLDHFQTTYLKEIQITSLTDYEIDTDKKSISIAFAETKLDGTLAEVLARQGLSQLHIAETEKQAHITYFLNGGNESKEPGEEHLIIPSKKVRTYDLAPEMSTIEIADALIKNLAQKNYDFYAVNIASSDMVGHTGNLEAGVKAIEAIDEQLGRIYKEIENQNGFMMIVSDHGNVEEMINPTTGEMDTEHNVYPSPFLLVSPKLKRETPSFMSLEDMAVNPSGTLADVMPTILELYDIPMPEVKVSPEQKGISLIGRLR